MKFLNTLENSKNKKLITFATAIVLGFLFLLSYNLSDVKAAGLPDPTPYSPYSPYGPYGPHNPEDTGIAEFDLILGASLGLYGTGASVVTLATNTKKKLFI